jgi:hypothetical protein
MRFSKNTKASKKNFQLGHNEEFSWKNNRVLMDFLEKQQNIKGFLEKQGKFKFSKHLLFVTASNVLICAYVHARVPHPPPPKKLQMLKMS